MVAGGQYESSVPNPNDQTGPPTDFGLTASNPAFIQAARDNGVQYLHGNMSFGSHAAAVAGCFSAAGGAWCAGRRG